MALASRVGVDAEDGDLAPRRTGVGVLARPDRGEADDLVAGAGDHEAVDALGRGGQALAPRAGEGVGLEEGDDLVGDASGVGLAEHGRLDEADGGGVVGAGPAHARVGERGGRATDRGSPWS